MGSTMTRSLGLLPTLLLILGAFPLFAQVLERPPTGYTSPTIYRPGPSWLTATAVVPMRLDLKWAAVADAKLYRLTRSSPSVAETQLEEIWWNTADQDLAGKYYFHFDYLPERSGSTTFSYKVYAIFVGTDGSRTVSAASPTAAVTALPPLAPPKLKYRVSVSPLMGRLRVILDWGKVNGATGYHVFQIPRLGQPPLPMLETTVQQISFVIDNVEPGQGGTVCVYTIYEAFLKDTTVRSCVWVVTSKS